MGPSTSHSSGGRGPSRPGERRDPAPDPLPVLNGQARRLLGALREQETFLRLNPFLALLLKAVSKRSPGRPA